MAEILHKVSIPLSSDSDIKLNSFGNLYEESGDGAELQSNRPLRAEELESAVRSFGYFNFDTRYVVNPNLSNEDTGEVYYVGLLDYDVETKIPDLEIENGNICLSSESGVRSVIRDSYCMERNLDVIPGGVIGLLHDAALTLFDDNINDVSALDSTSLGFIYSPRLEDNSEFYIIGPEEDLEVYTDILDLSQLYVYLCQTRKNARLDIKYKGAFKSPINGTAEFEYTIVGNWTWNHLQLALGWVGGAPADFDEISQEPLYYIKIKKSPDWSECIFTECLVRIT